MPKTLTVQLETPISSASFVSDLTPLSPTLEDSTSAVSSLPPEQTEVVLEEKLQKTLTQEVSDTQKNEFSQAFQAISDAATKLNHFYETVFAEQKEEITKLSMEIARKVLMQKVEDGDYKIESIIKEALSNAPTRQDVVVHLNPEDLSECQKALGEKPDGDFADVKFVSDSKIGRAECLLESPKGIVESLINEHLDRISKALKKTE
jgi:flagellar biosynthesis/type III secretory pathway protein FliH